MEAKNKSKTEIVLTPLTERGLAEIIAGMNIGKAFYNKELKAWFVWGNNTFTQDGIEFESRIWDNLDQLKSLAQPNCNIKTTDGQVIQSQDFIDFLNSKSTASIANKLKRCARSLKAMIAREEEFDTHKHIIACRVTYCDLKTGKALQPDPSYKITRCCKVEPSEKADYPEFQKFLEKILESKSLINYMQVLLGYLLTGETDEQELYLFFGTGANGKSTILEVIRKILGPLYAMTTDSKTFLVSQARNVRNDIARLKRARAVISSEIPQGGKMDENTIKLLTGGDKVECRYLYKEFFEYTPQFKIILAANNLPEIQGADYGIKRRIKIIPFKKRINPEEMDKKLSQKLEKELPGIFRWMIEGAREWYENGFPECPEVEKATKEFWEKKDQVEEFLEDCCEKKMGKTTPVSDLYDSYSTWVRGTDYQTLKKRVFGMLMRQKEYKQTKSGSKRYWTDISITK
jgi:putative DNA primase/helicase